MTDISAQLGMFAKRPRCQKGKGKRKAPKAGVNILPTISIMILALLFTNVFIFKSAPQKPNKEPPTTIITTATPVASSILSAEAVAVTKDLRQTIDYARYRLAPRL